MDEQLYHAIIEDNRSKLRTILRNGGDPNAWLEDVVRCSGKSILHMCCEKGRYRCAQAICDDRPTRLEAFLRQGGDPNMWIEDSARISTKSFLHVCCEKGRVRCVKVLLEFGAQVDIQGSWGQTPLMLCVMTEYFDIAELLINYNKEIINQQDTYGNTPLHIAIENDSVEGVQLLLRHKADVNVMNSNGITPLMKICSIKESENMAKIATILMDAGAQVDIADFRSRRTALQLAVSSKNVETVQILLNAGADCNTIDSGWRTPITNVIWEHLRLYPTHHVIADEIMMIICMLVQHGADLNINSHEHTNALVMALYFKVAPLVRFLLLNGATQEGKFFGGITPLHHAVNKRDIDSLKELLKWSKRDLYTKAHVNKYQYELFLDPFEFAVHKGYPELAIVMAEVGYKLNHISYLTDFSVEPPNCLKENPDILDTLRSLATQPLSLFYIAVLCVRNSLDGDIEHGANLLPLPKLLIDNIKLRDVLCE